eukprot:TRINITY_DN18152_c0_g1_i2.p1 TRINITY_DN18152_c0_g1~~TRINITY_DN18152_c0_g1_i2.p1  ORF type:complete len:243 (+),score=36.48 TRINITY_DN18152_c0_g1_i2:151-879(+)
MLSSVVRSNVDEEPVMAASAADEAVASVMRHNDASPEEFAAMVAAVRANLRPHEETWRVGLYECRRDSATRASLRPFSHMRSWARSSRAGLVERSLRESASASSSGRSPPRPPGVLHCKTRGRSRSRGAARPRVLPAEPTCFEDVDVEAACVAMRRAVDWQRLRLEQQAAELDEERQQRRELEHRLADVQKRLQCAVCFEGERNVAFQPCFHLVACEDCQDRLRVCPLCREPVQGRLKVRLP